MTTRRRVESVDVEVGHNIRIHAEVSGDGPPVVLLHGFTGDASTMQGLSRRLAERHLVIVPDLVGHGGSSIPAPVSAYGVGAMARHVASLGTTLGHDSFHLVGYSMGGRVALTLACDTPDRVRSLALIGASAGIADVDDRARRRADDDALADRIESGGLEDFVDYWLAKPLFATQSRLGAAHLAHARRQRLGNDPRGLARSLRGGGTGAMTPLHERLAAIAVPTTAIAGGDDPRFCAVATDLADSMPNAQAVVIPGAGHAVHLEQPDAVTGVIAESISEVDKP